MATATESPPSAQPAPASPAGPPARIGSVDLLRGAVMVPMVLDHARDYFSGADYSAVDLDHTTPALFLTRWATHFCAPAFVFLAGAGIYLAATRGKSRPELSRFLLARGLWLVVLELTVVRFGMTFNLDYRYVPAGVLWAIGWSMVALAGLIWLPMRAVAAFGVALIAGHDLLDPIRAESLGRLAWLWKILHEQGSIRVFDGVTLHVLYPLVPWVGVMAAGYAFGALLRERVRRQRQLLFVVGVSMIGAFVALRAINVYGDPAPWRPKGDFLLTAFSFINLNKYPPSFLFLLMTLGPTLLALGFLRDAVGRLGGLLATFGRVPMFYYLLQWPLVHALALAASWAAGRPWRWLVASEPFRKPPDAGFGLPAVYLAWAIAVLLLYPPCRWFADLKRRRKDPWLSYF